MNYSLNSAVNIVPYKNCPHTSIKTDLTEVSKLQCFYTWCRSMKCNTGVVLHTLLIRKIWKLTFPSLFQWGHIPNIVIRLLPNKWDRIWCTNGSQYSGYQNRVSLEKCGKSKQ